MDKARLKTERVIAALEHREADRVPVGEFFWTNFLRRARAELDVGDDFDPYRYWDLDMIVITPNLDPHITGIEILKDDGQCKLVKTGFGATIERRSTYPMPRGLASGAIVHGGIVADRVGGFRRAAEFVIYIGRGIGIRRPE